MVGLYTALLQMLLMPLYFLADLLTYIYCGMTSEKQLRVLQFSVHDGFHVVVNIGQKNNNNELF